MLKLKYFHLKRRLPACYLLSSKFILSLAIIICFYIMIMDIKLFKMARTRGAFVPLLKNSTNKHSSTIHEEYQLKSNQNYPSSTSSFKPLLSSSYSSESSPSSSSSSGFGSSMFRPLPVKKIMMAEATHYIRSPIAEFIEHGLGFSTIFPFISANFISVSHCVLSVVSIKFLVHDSLFWRQIGVCLFQFRNFLDSFDGVIFRAHAKRSTYKSHYGSIGYFVDAFSDVFGGICLIGSVAIYLLKNRPLNKKLTKCFRVADDIEDSTMSIQSNINEKSPQFNSDKSSKNLFSSSTASSPSYNSSSNGYFFRNNKTNYYKESGLYASKIAILASVGLLGIRLALSALFWDRSVHTYQDLLDSPAKSELHQQLQINVLKSTITLFIMFGWRIMCALSLQDMILTAIFIDKIWEFVVKSQYIGWLALICLIILTELHVAEVRSILLQAF